MGLSPYKRNEFQEGDRGFRAQGDFIIEHAHLQVIYQHNKAISLKSLNCLFELCLRVNVAWFVEPIAIKRSLGFPRLD